MKNLYRVAAATVAAACLPAAAQAQIGVLGVWEGTAPSRTIVVNNNFPQACLPSLSRAVGRFHAVESKLTINYTNPSWTSYTIDNAPNTYSYTIVEAKTMSVPGRVAEVGHGHKTTAPTMRSDGVPYLAYADLAVNRDVIYYASGYSGGQFHCPATGGTAVRSGSYDMEYTFTHEVTHVAGVDHNPNPGTLMYREITGNTPTPAYGSDESGLVLRLYGRR
jgi:hypothetical protein